MVQFSVVTITYNAERFLAETLRSVAHQKDACFEHVLWDGGSQDRTLDIAHSFAHVKIIEGKDSGISDAMNKAVAHAQGQYVIFLHADDLFLHHSVLKSYDRVFAHHPQCEWIYGRAHIIDEQGTILRTTPYEPFSLKRLKKYNFITHPTVCLSRSLWLRGGGFDTSLRYCMDYALWLKLSQLVVPLPLATPLASFREHQGSLSTSEPLQVAKEAYEVRRPYLKTPLEKLRSLRTLKQRTRHLREIINAEVVAEAVDAFKGPMGSITKSGNEEVREEGGCRGA